MKYIFIPFIIIILGTTSISGQQDVLSDHNTIGWLAYTGLFKVSHGLSVHTEIQHRRVGLTKDLQQNLFRTGILVSLHKDVTMNIGYAYIHTAVYGDYPPAFDFPERRIFQQLIIKNPIGNFEISHRFTLEQRFLGLVSQNNQEISTSFNFLNRLRYRVKAEFPLFYHDKNLSKWSIILQDEVFIGWGKNLGINIFDQNRISLLIGLKVNSNVKLETGFQSQILQQGKRTNDLPVFQYNNGILVSGILNFDLRKDH